MVTDEEVEYEAAVDAGEHSPRHHVYLLHLNGECIEIKHVVFVIALLRAPLVEEQWTVPIDGWMFACIVLKGFVGKDNKYILKYIVFCKLILRGINSVAAFFSFLIDRILANLEATVSGNGGRWREGGVEGG
jgi:hypothetical protein